MLKPGSHRLEKGGWSLDKRQMPTALDDAISVRVAGVKKFKAVPVASRGQIAIEIRGRHED